MRKTILKALGVTALAAVLTASVTAPVQAATIKTTGSDQGVGSVWLLFDNQEASPAPASLVPVTPALGYLAPGAQSGSPRMVLADDALTGTFAMTFHITHRGVAAFDSFIVKNTGSRTFNLVYTSEDEFNFPDRDVDDNQLSVCFLQGCQFGVWVPDGAVAPPVTLLQLGPGQEARVDVGLRLESGASWADWDNYLRVSLLHLQAVAV